MLDPYVRDLGALQREFHAFDMLMQPGTPLGEKADILPFFRQNRHLAAYLGYANNYLVSPGLLGIEHNLLGFRCDIAIGDSTTGQFTLVELEDAAADSIFRRPNRNRAYPQWSPRFEEGFSQLVDWALRIDQERQPSVTLEPIFGTPDPKIHYLLVIGRDHWLDAAGSARLNWRRRHNGIQVQLTTIWTYDLFLDFVRRRIADAQV
jgi:hypothetical protein